MFKYLINDQEVTFNSEEERLKGIAEAEANDYSIELLEEPEFETSDAPESAFSQVISGKVPEAEEDFIQDPAKSADAVSETVAQDDTVLPQAGTSLDLPSSEDIIIDGEKVTEQEFKEYEKTIAEKDVLEKNEFILSPTGFVDFFQDIATAAKEGWRQGELLDPSYELYQLGDKATDEDVLKFINKNKEVARKNLGSAEMQDFNKIYEEEGGGFWGFVKGVANNPSVLTTTLVSSLSSQLSSLQSSEARKAAAAGATGGAIIGSTVPILGTATGAISGAMAGTMGVMETGLTFAELLEDEAGGLDAKKIKDILQDPEKLAELKNKALGRGLTIVAVEMATLGLSKGVGGKLASAGFRGAPAVAAGTTGAIEMAGGGTGEVLGRFVAGQEMDAAEIGFETFASLGGAPLSLGSQALNLQKNINNIKINKEIKKSDFNSITEAFKPDAGISSSVVNISEIKGSLDFVNKAVDAEVTRGDITQEDGDAIKKNAAYIQGAAQKVDKSNVSSLDKVEAVELLAEKNKLAGEIKTIGDKALSAPQELRLKTVNELLGKLVKKGTAEKAVVSTKAAKKIISQIGDAKFTEAKNRAEIDEIFKKINESDPEAPDVKYDNQYGVIVERANGETEIIINQEETFKDGIINTAAHEVLHFALQNTLKSSLTEDTQIKVGDALIDFLETIEKDTNLGAFENRFLDYIDAFKKGDIKRGDLAEEAITVLSEAMLNGQVKYTETLGTKLMDFGRRLASALGYKAKFNTGQDVFNFIRDYNNSIKKGGKLSKGLKKSLKEGVKGKLTKTETTEANKKQSVKPSLTTNKVDTALAALEEAEALRDEDFDNPTLAANVEKAEAAYDQALIEAENLEEDAAVDAPEEATSGIASVKEKIVRPKADKTKRRYSLDADVKKEIEPQIAKAQALNKELIAQEKELNKKAIADIEAIPDKKVKRTEKDKRIAELKTNPLRVSKSNELNKLEREISKELKTPIDKAVNLFTKLYYDKISDNAKTAVTRDEFKESARAEITSITINEFKPKTINRQGESVVNDIEDIIFQRGGLRLRSLAERLGVVGKDQGIARGAEALIKMADSSSDINFDENDKDSVRSEEKRKVSALLASEARYNQAREQVVDFWKENEGNTKVENFKKLPNLINNILAEMFNVTEGTLTARSGNLNKADYANAVKAFTEKQAVFTVKEGDTKKEVRVPVSEVSAFQDGLNEKKADIKEKLTNQ